MTKLPEYTDGCFELCRIKNDMAGDYPIETLEKTGLHICYIQTDALSYAE